jgi:uncharacterized protein YdhG (YjbR/CyaY superfamily)
MITTIPDYILTQDENVRPLLQEVYACIRAAIPEAEERISWSMPTWPDGVTNTIANRWRRRKISLPVIR